MKFNVKTIFAIVILVIGSVSILHSGHILSGSGMLVLAGIGLIVPSKKQIKN